VWRKVVAIALSLGVTLLVFAFFLPKVASYSEVWSTITDMTWLEVSTLAIVALWNLISYQPVLMAALPGLSFGQATISSQASTAVANTVPAGAAFGLGFTAAMYRSWGFKRRPVTLSLLVSGIWNNLTKLALPIVALALVVVSGDPGGGLVIASIIGVIALVAFLTLFTAILRSESAAFRIGEWGSDFVNRIRRRRDKSPIGGFGHTLVKFRRETIELVRHRWIALTLTTIISQLSLFLVLLVALRHVGVSNAEVSWQEALATFAFVRLLAAVPITPGGLGVVELGLTGGLVAAGGDGVQAQVVAATLVFRALTFLPPIPIGAVCYFLWRRQVARKPSSDAAAPAVAPT
jgi:putative heme transporter